MDTQALPRSVWQDLAAIQGRTPRVCLPPDNGPGRKIVYLVEYILYETTDLLQAEGHIALAYHADLETSSGALHYVLRECGRVQVLTLRPQVGEILTLTPSITNEPSQTIQLMKTRANQREPLVADDFLLCVEKLIAWLEDRRISSIHFPILHLERPVYTLANLYQVMKDLFAGTNFNVVLHNRLFVTILCIDVGNELP